MNRNKNESDLKKNVDFNVAVGAGKGVTTKRFSAENSAISEILNSKSPKPFAPEKISNLNKLLDENYKKKLIATLQLRNNKYDDTEKIECDSKETNGNINTQNINNSFCKERTNIPLNKSKCSDHTHISSDSEENNVCINKIQDNESYKNQSLVENETNDLSYFKNNNTHTDDSTCTPDEENSNNELPPKKSTHFFLYFFNLKKKNRNSNEDKQKTQKMSNYPNGLIPPKKNRRSLKYLFFY